MWTVYWVVLRQAVERKLTHRINEKEWKDDGHDSGL